MMNYQKETDETLYWLEGSVNQCVMKRVQHVEYQPFPSTSSTIINHYRLELLYAAEVLTETEYSSLHKDAEEVLKLLKSTILSKKKNMLRNK